MLKNDDIELVRQSVTMKDIAAMYGYRVTRTGYISCPFHGEDKHPSMRVYDGERGYYCFVCNVGGDVIDFVKRHDGIGFEQAVRVIASHFGIPISDGNSELSDQDKAKIAERKAKREAAERQRKAVADRLDWLSCEIHRLQGLQAGFEPLGHVWSAIQKKIEKAEAEWETLFNNRSERG